MSEKTQELTPAEEQQLIRLLERTTQPWSYSLFRALVTMFPYPSVEVILLKREGDKILVHLCERDASDPDFAGQLHFTGTVSRNTDDCWDDAIQRVIQKELGTTLTNVEYVSFPGEPPLFIHSPRGVTAEIVFLCTVKDEPTVGAFYDVDNLPNNFIPHQQAALDLAIRYFRSRS